TATGDTLYRAKLVAKILEIAGKTDIPIGVGISFPDNQKFQEEWIKDYSLDKYPGKVFYDGIKVMIDIIMSSSEKVTIISIASLPNIAMAIKNQPKIINKIRFIGMHGSIYRGYNGKDTPDAEANVKYHNKDCRYVFSKLKNITITPLDTCGIVRLEGFLYKKILKSKDPLIKAVIENYKIWKKNVSWHVDCNPDKNTSILFDTVAVYLTFTEKFLKMKKIKIKIRKNGMTIPDKNGVPVRAALDWKNLVGFKNLLVKKLIV
ncbi:MAG: nucleoside hydrolase, partial [Candidatus Goldbacteria bacterium]|nr:nucleoside hydrolase [Candidatus Goldiibacteriota bacterium]